VAHFVNMTERIGSQTKTKTINLPPCGSKGKKTGSCVVSLPYFNKQQKKKENNN